MSIASSRPSFAYPEPGEYSTFEVDFDEYMAMPECNQHVEVVDGVIYVMPGPTPEHQLATGSIYLALVAAATTQDLGLVLPSPLDVVVRKRPKLRVRQPDVLYFSNERAGLRVRDHLRSVRDGTLKPNLVVEVLSPGQNERTLAQKLADYASIRVEEVWFADQEKRTIRVLALDGDGYRVAGDFGAGDQIASAVLPGLALDIAAVFA